MEDRREQAPPLEVEVRCTGRLAAQLEGSRGLRSVRAGRSVHGRDLRAARPVQEVGVELLEEPGQAGDLCTRHWLEGEPPVAGTGHTVLAGTGRGREAGDLRTVLLLEEEEEWSSREGRGRSLQERGRGRPLG